MGRDYSPSARPTCATTTTASAATGSMRMPTRNPGWGVGALVLLVLLLGIPTTQTVEVPLNEAVITLSACFSSSEKVLEARCPPGQMVNILEVFYGHSENGSCHHVEGDCTQTDVHTHRCVGRESCEVNLPSGTLGRLMPHCGLYSNYMQLTHTCVPETSVYDICKHKVLNDQSGYVKTPSYPNNYPQGLSCTMSIKAQSSQKIKLHVIDLDLESGPAGCADLLYVHGTFRVSSLCGQRGSEEIFKTMGTMLHLNFTSDFKGQNKGFWLYYEAFPLISSTAAPSTTPVLTTTHLPRTGSRHHTTMPSTGSRPLSVLPPGDSTEQVLYSPNMQEDHRRLPMEAIIGGLLGSLLCILLVLAILLFIKRRKERDAIPPSTSTCFLHSKTTGVPGASGPYIQNNLALVDDSGIC